MISFNLAPDNSQFSWFDQALVEIVKRTVNYKNDIGETKTDISHLANDIQLIIYNLLTNFDATTSLQEGIVVKLDAHATLRLRRVCNLLAGRPLAFA